MKSPDENYWRKKLNAFMHDNPDKATDVKFHELNALANRMSDQFTDKEYFDKSADWRAAAADRLPFPKSSKMVAAFDGKEHAFRHPLGGGDEGALVMPLEKKILSGVAYESANDTRVILESGDARADFICRWRYWRHWACEREPAFVYLPADTRIPDHTIWNHLSVTTALQGCRDLDPEGREALLLFSIGPVQPLIAAARSFRDLWSGSYLLSYLVSTALREIALNLGPDHIIFPSAWGQPLMDLMMKDVYKDARIRAESEQSLWDSLWEEKRDVRKRYLLPSLPNRFLALVPACYAESIGEDLRACIQKKLSDIGESILKGVDVKLKSHEVWHPERVIPQLERTLEYAWQVFPLPTNFSEGHELAQRCLPGQKKHPSVKNGDKDLYDPACSPDRKEHPSIKSLERLREMWNALPKEDQTSYAFKEGTGAWPALYAMTAWLHDGCKQTRAFEAWNSDCSEREGPGRHHTKDYLTGKEEVVLRVPDGDDVAADKFSRGLADDNPHVFKPGENLGALSLVKRLWHIYWLSDEGRYGFKAREDFVMPNLHQLAGADPDGDDAKNPEEKGGGQSEYIAVLALDGDSMGKWISGDKMPKVRDQLAQEALAYFEKSGSDQQIEAFLDGARPLNPSFHLQFSEMLANFGLYAAGRIVGAHGGRLIYAGGDDVLAVLPANRALKCAAALRAAFRGDVEALKEIQQDWENEEKVPLFKVDARRRGAFQLHPYLHERKLALEIEPKGYDILVPGPASDCSVGIAVAHYKAPLQDVVRAAQKAEKSAKKHHGRSAFALTLLKRSGEITEWGAKWSSGGLELFSALLEALQEKRLSAKFPHRVCELLEPYASVGLGGGRIEDAITSEEAAEIIRREFAFAVSRHGATSKGGGAGSKTAALDDERLKELLNKYLSSLNVPAVDEDDTDNKPSPTQRLIGGVIGLCVAVAFISRKNNS